MRNEAWIRGRVMMGSRIPGPRGVTNRGPNTWLIGKKVLWAGAAPGPVPERGAGPGDSLGRPGPRQEWPSGAFFGLRRFFPLGTRTATWPGAPTLGIPGPRGPPAALDSVAGMDLESPTFFEASRFPKKENVACCWGDRTKGTAGFPGPRSPGFPPTFRTLARGEAAGGPLPRPRLRRRADQGKRGLPLASAREPAHDYIFRGSVAPRPSDLETRGLDPDVDRIVPFEELAGWSGCLLRERSYGTRGAAAAAARVFFWSPAGPNSLVFGVVASAVSRGRRRAGGREKP